MYMINNSQVLATTPHSLHKLENDDGAQQFQLSQALALGSLRSFPHPRIKSLWKSH